LRGLDTPSDPVESLTRAPLEGDRLSLDARLSWLQVLLRAKGFSLDLPQKPDEPEARRSNEAWRRRMSAFTDPQIERVSKKLGPVLHAPWPALDGCLGVLFTSRAGSSYLARQLAKRFKIGRMEESLNPDLIEGIAPANIVRAYANGWFSFKLGVPGIISAELSGMIEQYLDMTSFILLLRKDIVAQAVSLVKAKQTGQWHSNSAPKHEPVYDATQLEVGVRTIAKDVSALRDFLDRAERPWRKLFYEDFEHGDFSIAEAICDGFAIPRLKEGQGPQLGPLSRTTDDVNEIWRARFCDDVDKKTSEIIESYRASL
jgi:hypothetical protein